MRFSSQILRGTTVMFVLLLGCQSPVEPDDSYVVEARNHVRAAWSPDGATIAFTAAINNVLGIYLVDTSGANPRILVASDAVGATWSPDNQWVAYSAGGILYKMRINGTKPDTISPTGFSIRPSWSKDGTKIAFVRSPNIFVRNLLTGVETDLLLQANYPSWHPNGNEIVAQETNAEAGLYRFTAVHDSTKVVRSLYSFATADECGFSSISPNGDAIVYARKADRGYTQIWKVNLAIGQHVQLTDTGDFPAWSPDGAKIVYTRTAVGDGALWIMNADGTQKRRLTASLGL